MEALATLMHAIDAALAGQSEAAQDGDAQRSAHLIERGAALLDEVRAQGRKAELLPLIPLLRRFRDVATYNQLLLRYAFTSWAALCLDRERRAYCYNAHGHLSERGPVSSGRARRASLGVL